MEQRVQLIENAQHAADVERMQLKTDMALTYREISRRLDEISRDVKDIKQQ